MLQRTINSLGVFPMKWELAAQNFEANHAEAPYIRVSRNRSIVFIYFGRCPSKASIVIRN
jgi:hypothetical protein